LRFFCAQNLKNILISSCQDQVLNAELGLKEIYLSPFFTINE